MNIQDMLKLKTHEEVVTLLLSHTDETHLVYKTAKFTIIIPQGIDETNPAPMLCVHTDTIGTTPTKLDYTAGVITNPHGVLGADDRAGCWIVNELLKDKDNRFIIGIFDEEEVGGIGSSELSKSKWFNSYCIKDTSSIVSSFIGLDRRGGDEVAYYGMESESFVACIEDTFPELREVMGSFTDASNLAYEYQISCCNLSVGYYNEHTTAESLNVKEMERMLKILREADVTALSSRVYDVEYIPYKDVEVSSYKYEVLATSKYKVIKCDVCGIADTLYEGEFGLHVCEYCLEDMDNNSDEIEGF